MSRLGAKIQRQRATEARVARRLIRELLPPPPASPAPAPERLGFRAVCQYPISVHDRVEV